MSSPAPKAPPGWYDDASLLGIKRYWDGSAWTEQTRPAAQVPRNLGSLDHPMSRTAIVVAGIAVLVAIAALVFAFTRPAETPTVAPSPSASPTPSEIAIPPGDYEDFVESASSNLDDIDKDLDDIETTIDESGYWRLISNTAELRFNLEQLRGTAAPKFLAADWDDALDAFDDALQDLGNTINESDDTQRDALDATRTASAEVRALVELLDR